MDEEDPAIAIDEVESEIEASLERARELLCEAKLTLRQERADDPLFFRQ